MRFGSNYEGSQVIDVRKGEMLCPLCKSIGNSILPYTPPFIAQSLLPLSAPPPESPRPSVGGIEKGRISCLSNLLEPSAECRLNFQNEFVQYVRSLLPAVASTSVGVEDSIEPIDVSSFEKASEQLTSFASSSASSSASLAYDAVIAAGMFQKDILSNFIPLWSTESSTFATRFQSLLKSDLGRSTHLTWSAAAYTLLSASRTKSWVGHDKLGKDALYRHGLLDSEEDKKEILFIHQLLLFLRSIAPKVDNNGQSVLKDGIIAPLGDLLGGCKTSCTASIFAQTDGERVHNSCILTAFPTDEEVRSAVLTQPLLSVGTLAFPDLQRQSIVMGHASRIITNNVSAGKVSSEEIWPFLLTPLLEHDLHTVAIAFASTATDLAKTMDALSLICLARLAQILIEPASTGLASKNSKTATALLKSDALRNKVHTIDSNHYNNNMDPGFVPPRVMVVDKAACYSMISVMNTDIDSPSAQTSRGGVKGFITSEGCMGSSRKREREREESRCQDSEKGVVVAPVSDPVKSPLEGSDVTERSNLDIADKLLFLRDVVSVNCGYSTVASSDCIPKDGTAENGLDLLSTVLDSWLPFLEFCCSLRVVLLSGSAAAVGQADSIRKMRMEDDNGSPRPQAIYGDIRHLCTLLRTLGVLPLTCASLSSNAPSQLQKLLSSTGLIGMCILWSEQVCTNTISSAVASSSTSWIPRPETSMKASSTKSCVKLSSEPSRQVTDGSVTDILSSLDPSAVPIPPEEIRESTEALYDESVVNEFDLYHDSESEDEEEDEDDSSNDTDDHDDVDIENGDDHDDEDYDDDDEYVDSEDERDDELGFFEQQIAGFLADHTNDENGIGGAPDMGGLMAAVMQHMGMEPDMEMPANLAAMFQTLQVPYLP